MLKKIISCCILISFGIINFNTPCFCAPQKTVRKKTYYASVSYKVRKKQKPQKPKKPEFKIPLIEDETAAAIDKKKYKKARYTPSPIIDEAAQNELKNKKLAKKQYKKEFIDDEEIVYTKNNIDFKKPVYKGIERTDVGVKVVLKPVSKVRTKNAKLKIKNAQKYENYKIALPELGETVEFLVIEDVKKDGKIVIPKNSKVIAQIAEVSPRAMGGAPAEMTIEKFKLIDKNGKTIPLSGNLSSSGYTLSPWIGLAELATTPFLFGLAVPLLRVLPGGQAVVTPRKNYIVYY